tara:strand:+ start:2648 stop:2824 length:177 start_codon:yes stop_codon:yes gene_type:complete
MILLLKSFCRKLFGENTTNKDRLWVYVPSTCKSRTEKDFVLFDKIEDLEQNIKINNKL